MVDFQSRDTSRGYGNDEESEDSDEEDTEESEQVEESAAGEEATATGESEPAEGSEDETIDFGPETLPYAVVTVANEGTIEGDATGGAVIDAIEHAGDAVVTRELVGSGYDSVQSTVGALTRRKDVAAIVTVGGTGIASDDETVDAVEPLFDKQLPGFGELYRVLSHDFDGTAVVRTRVTAGVLDGVPVFCLPEDTAGARRGVEQIVLEEAEAIVEAANHE
jgi:molybdenum cofactor biosynthesis protein B